MILLYVITVIFLAYSVLLLWYWWKWRSVPEFHLKKENDLSFSLIIPARNEEKNIGRLLDSVINQDFPETRREIIVVDDHSEDGTSHAASSYPQVRVIPLQEDPETAHKKKAIETGIAVAKHEWILATDADCIVPRMWMKTMGAYAAEKDSVFIAAPVVIENNAGVVAWFQSMDFLMLQAITGAAVSTNAMSMCNGANLAYQKSAFLAVNGFAGIDDIASGDDMLLMHKISEQFPGRVHYLKSKDAIVSTAPVSSWKDFIRQRIRWASKARRYKDPGILPVLALVYVFNLSFLFLALAACRYPYLWYGVGGLWVGKTIVELPLFCAAAVFFNRRKFIPVFFFFQPLHILYTIISGAFSQFGKNYWKGRNIK